MLAAFAQTKYPSQMSLQIQWLIQHKKFSKRKPADENARVSLHGKDPHQHRRERSFGAWRTEQQPKSFILLTGWLYLERKEVLELLLENEREH